MSKKFIPPAHEIELFLKTVKGVKRLQKKERVKLSSSSSKPLIKQDRREPVLSFSEKQILPPLQGEDSVCYLQTGTPHIILRKLQKGQYNVEAILDLHGLSVEKAEIALSHFLQQCIHRKLHAVLIIHGKGDRQSMPVLKNKLNHWLREWDMVLAFCSATPKQGGSGAMQVLLKYGSEDEDIG